MNSFHRPRDLSVGPRDENVVRRALSPQHAADDFRHLTRSFPRPEDHFRKTLTQRAMMVHLGEAQILKGQVFQAGKRILRAELPGSRWDTVANREHVAERKTNRDYGCDWSERRHPGAEGARLA